ncbi:MAG TPA: GNAT family N-acetyltransferase [Terriglobales bacterium]|nr:GNAT family N-acetyltransferase [Terriglobales bacterium]
MQFLNCELVRRFEAAEAIPQVHFAKHLERVKPDLKVAYEVIGGAHTVFIHPGCVVGRCVGLGLNGTVSAADLDRVEQFYISRGESPQVDVVPVADQSLFELMKQRPYRFEELNNVLVRPLSKLETLASRDVNAEIRRSSPEECEALCEVVARAFLEGKDPDPQFVDVFRPLYGMEGAFSFAAYVDGKMVGGASGMLIPEAGIAAFFGSSTLPEYRGSGIQGAFLRERLKLAAEAGCEYAVIVTRGGSTSQRNCERAGFRVAYSKPVMKMHLSV